MSENQIVLEVKRILPRQLVIIKHNENYRKDPVFKNVNNLELEVGQSVKVDLETGTIIEVM